MEIFFFITNAAMLGFFAGIVLNFMPCILPLISIKLAGFSKLQTRKEVRILAGSMVFGILTFCLLASGIFIFFQNLYWGFQLQFPSFIAVLIFIFSVFFLVLMGNLNINPPIFIRPAQSKVIEGFISGFLIVIFSLSCVAPVVSSAVSFAFSSGRWYLLMISLFFIGIGLSMPYILVGFFGLKLNLQGSGIAMKFAKTISYIAIFATLFYLIYVLYSQIGFFLTLISISISIIFTLLLYKWKNFYIFVVGVILIAFVPFFNFQKAEISMQTSIIPFTEERLESQLNQGKTVLISFEASWCVICKTNVATTFNTNEFRNFMSNNGIIFMKGDLTGRNKSLEDFMKRYDVYGVPFYIVFSPENRSGKTLPLLLTSNILIKEIENFKNNAHKGRK